MNDDTGKNYRSGHSKYSSQDEVKSGYNKKASSQWTSSAAFTVTSADHINPPPNGIGAATKAIPFTKLYEQSKRLVKVDENEEEKETRDIEKPSQKRKETARKKRRDTASFQQSQNSEEEEIDSGLTKEVLPQPTQKKFDLPLRKEKAKRGALDTQTLACDICHLEVPAISAVKIEACGHVFHFVCGAPFFKQRINGNKKEKALEVCPVCEREFVKGSNNAYQQISAPGK